MGNTNALCNKISSFQQQANKSIPEAWEHMQENVTTYLHRGMEDWLLIKNFYHAWFSSPW